MDGLQKCFHWKNVDQQGFVTYSWCPSNSGTADEERHCLLPSKSCMEIKESSPVSPSGYYTISNGSGGFVVVYCNMDELYSCPSLEQTLKGFSNNLSWISSNIHWRIQEGWGGGGGVGGHWGPMPPSLLVNFLTSRWQISLTKSWILFTSEFLPSWPPFFQFLNPPLI